MPKLKAETSLRGELEIKGSYAFTRQDFAEALSLLQNKALPVGSFVWKKPLEEGQRIFEGTKQWLSLDHEGRFQDLIAKSVGNGRCSD